MPSTGSPEAEAARVLHDHWAGVAGEVALPVDPVRIARHMGIEVYSSRLDNGVSAVIIAGPGQPVTIHVSDRDAWVRQRFSCAHEIGHYVRRKAEGAERFGFVDRRDHFSAEGVHPEERFANRFAAALLMPATLIRDAGTDDLLELAELFAVSTSAMELRLRRVRRAS